MGEKTSNEMGNLSLQTKKRFPRDLLQRFMAGTDPRGSGSGSDPEEEVELSLELSLGGRFGVDKTSSSSNKLVRSSSIAAILPVVRDDDVLGETGRAGPYSGLFRTTSLPVETEEEWRKRKDLQSLRRLAAKRRRSEKQRSLTAVPGAGCGFPQPSSQGSVESQASSISEFESRHLQGSSSGGEASPASIQSVQDRAGQDPTATGSSQSKAVEPTVRPSRPESENPSRNRGKETGFNSSDMPCVFTQGDGPNGRRIEGILYKYGKGEEVKIMCVCHGSFLSPAEFVKHAGGTDVVHPLRHIVVNPNSSSYL